MIAKEITSCIVKAQRIAIIGNGGNLAIASHGASDMTRHLNKHCFAPEAVHLTALGGDKGWHKKWIEEYACFADLIIGITTRVDSPIAQCHLDIAIAPMEIPNATYTHVIKEETYHEFEVAALLSLYQMMEAAGAVLPKIS